MAIVNSSRFNFKESVDTILNKYMYDGVVPAMSEAIDEVRREAVNKLKAESRAKGWKDYAKGWKSKRERGRYNVGAVVYGESGTYQIAHLLEHGHALRNGGRAKEFVHIAPVEEWAIDEAFERMVEKLENI